MSGRTLITAQKQTATPAGPVAGHVLQRKCDCGNHTMAAGRCDECSKMKPGMQRKLTVGSNDDPLEREADRIAEAVVNGSLPIGQSHSGPPQVQRQEALEKPPAQPTQFPAQEQPKHGEAKEDDLREKLKKGGLKAAGELAKRLWDQFSNSVEGKRILDENLRDLKPITRFFEDFAHAILGKIALGAAGGGAAAGAFAGALALRDKPGSDPDVSPSTGGPVPRAPKDEQFFGLELKWDFVTPPAAVTLKTPWIDSPSIPLASNSTKPTPPSPPPAPFKAAKIPRICTPADPQGDQGVADARSAFIFSWLKYNQEQSERQLREALDRSQLHAPPKYAPSVLKPLFKRESDAEADVDPQIVEDGLRSPGQSLDLATRTSMERRFGYDFSSVRVHTDSRAAESASALNARAYTYGQDVVFGPGRYSPTTTSGTRLLAHELAHVVQQTSPAVKLFDQAPLSAAQPAGTPHVGTAPDFLIQRAPGDQPDPGGILGGTKSTSRTVVLYHYGDLDGRESFTSPQSYPRLTDCDLASSQEEAAKYTGAPVNEKLRFKYQITIDRDYFDKNFKNTGTRGGFSEFGTKETIPIKYFQKVATLKVASGGGGPPSGGPGGGSGAGGSSGRPDSASASGGSSPTYGSLSTRQPDPKIVSERVELKKVGGSWVEISGEGASKPANGTYSFALRDGRMYGSRYGHLEASGGGRVRFAGDIQFSNGSLERWDAGSGSYKPVESFVEEIANEAKKAGLDLEYDKDPQKSKFRPIQGKTGQRQLPMHQEPKDSKLSKGPSSRGPAQGNAGGASGSPASGGGMRPPPSKPEGSVTPAMRAGARDMAKELGKNLKLMRAARILTTVTRVIEFAGALVMTYQSVSMAQHSLAGEGFILTERIKQSESLRDKANDLSREYPAFSDWVQSNGFPIYIAAVDPDSIEQLVFEISDLGADIAGQKSDLRKQSGRVKTALKEVSTKRQAARVILDDPVKLAALDHGGGTINAATLFAGEQDLSRIESALMQTDQAWDGVLGLMDSDIEFLAAWHGWLEGIGVASGKLKPTPTIVVGADKLKEQADASKP